MSAARGPVGFRDARARTSDEQWVRAFLGRIGASADVAGGPVARHRPDLARRFERRTLRTLAPGDAPACLDDGHDCRLGAAACRHCPVDERNRDCARWRGSGCRSEASIGDGDGIGRNNRRAARTCKWCRAGRRQWKARRDDWYCVLHRRDRVAGGWTGNISTRAMWATCLPDRGKLDRRRRTSDARMVSARVAILLPRIGLTLFPPSWRRSGRSSKRRPESPRHRPASAAPAVANRFRADGRTASAAA